jgi:hypothetical protein
MTCGIPGIVCQIPNSHVETLIGPDWCRLLSAIGKGGEVYIADLLLQCAVFAPMISEGGRNRGNYYQLSGG